jgi:hypothetical protein
MIVVSLSTSQNHTPRNYQNLSFCNTGRRSLRAKFLPFHKKKKRMARTKCMACEKTFKDIATKRKHVCSAKAMNRQPSESTSEASSSDDEPTKKKQRPETLNALALEMRNEMRALKELIAEKKRAPSPASTTSESSDEERSGYVDRQDDLQYIQPERWPEKESDLLLRLADLRQAMAGAPAHAIKQMKIYTTLASHLHHTNRAQLARGRPHPAAQFLHVQIVELFLRYTVGPESARKFEELLAELPSKRHTGAHIERVILKARSVGSPTPSHHRTGNRTFTKPKNGFRRNCIGPNKK